MNHTSHRWTREQIRAARMAPLVPLLHKRGLQLIQKETGNFELSAFPGLILKERYWRWPQRTLQPYDPSAVTSLNPLILRRVTTAVGPALVKMTQKASRTIRAWLFGQFL